jgi:hypothetical protein
LQAAEVLEVEDHVQDMCLALADKVFGAKVRRGSKRAKGATRINCTLSPKVLFRVFASRRIGIAVCYSFCKFLHFVTTAM